VLVGEQPGDQEDRQGEPFVGPAGRLLDQVLEEAGLAREEVFLTNAVKHFRHEGTRGKQRLHKSPARHHVVACRPWLEAELDRLRPEGVVLLGSVAASSLLGPAFRVTRERGRLLEWPDVPVLRRSRPWVLATVHPASVLRSRDREADRAGLVADLAVAAAALPPG
jgi:uracil-DNA glycosylase family protein